MHIMLINLITTELSNLAIFCFNCYKQLSMLELNNIEGELYERSIEPIIEQKNCSQFR